MVDSQKKYAKVGNRGFTLIELLVTISIIAILAAIGMVSYQVILKNSRDAKRQADFKILQSALEQYHSDQFFYPTRNPSVGPPCNNGELKMGCPLKDLAGNKTYLNLIPNDPLYPSGTVYYYDAKPGSAQPCENDPSKCKTYCIYAKMENLSSPSPLTLNCSSFPSGGYNYLVTPP